MKEYRAVRTSAGERATTGSSRPGIRPGVALGLLGTAFCAWLCLLMWHIVKGPARHHVEAGYDFAQKGQNLDAGREFEAAQKLDPNNADVQQILGQSYYAGGKWHHAIEALLQLNRLRPGTPHIDAMLASCYLNIGDPRSALTYGQVALKPNPNDVLALEACATAQTRLGDSPEERRYLERLVPLEPPPGAHLMTLAELALNARDFAECRSLADRALQQHADNAQARAMRGISTFFVDGSPTGMKQAESDLLGGLSYTPDAYYCHLYLGRIYHRLSKYPQSLDHLNAATRLNPHMADAYYDLAAVYERTGQRRSADIVRKRFQSLADETETTLHLKKQLELRSETQNASGIGGR